MQKPRSEIHWVLGHTLCRYDTVISTKELAMQHKDHEQDTRKQREAHDKAVKDRQDVTNDRKQDKPDTAQSAQEEFEQQTYNPPPLVHRDPTTGEAISQPLPKGSEANVNTVPATGDGSSTRAIERNPDGTAKTTR
jgi:hypothetical protein